MGAAGKPVRSRSSARIGTIAASLAAAAILLLPGAAQAAPMVIGSATGTQPCGANPFDSIQVSSAGAPYAVPTGGTLITSWSVFPGADTGPAGLEVWRPSAGAYTLVGSVLPQTLQANSLNTFAASIPVQAGDLLGLRVEGPLNCETYTANSADAIGIRFSATAAALGDVVSGLLAGPDEQLNVAATVDVTVTPPPPPPTSTPTSGDQCKDGGWKGLTDSQGTPFKNQGDCVSFVATDGANAAGGPPA